MAPKYEVVILTQSGGKVTNRLTTFLKDCAKQLWASGAVIADIKSWGNRTLAYRIRRKMVNHYHATYIGLHVYCSPPALHALEAKLRNEDLVLRFMSIKDRTLPALSKEARSPFRHRGPAEPEDLAADAMDAAKYEYRNMVMQRIFQGRTEQELLSEQMAQARFAQNYGRSAARKGTGLLELVRGGSSTAAIEPSGAGKAPAGRPALGGVLGAALEASKPLDIEAPSDSKPPSPDSDKER